MALYAVWVSSFVYCICMMSCTSDKVYYIRYLGKESSLLGSQEITELDTVLCNNDSLAYIKAYEHFRVKKMSYEVIERKTKSRLNRILDTFEVRNREGGFVIFKVPASAVNDLDEYTDRERERMLKSKSNE